MIHEDIINEVSRSEQQDQKLIRVINVLRLYDNTVFESSMMRMHHPLEKMKLLKVKGSAD